MNTEFPISHQMKAFLKNDEFNKEVIKDMFELAADNKPYVDIEDFKIFIHHFIVDCQISLLPTAEEEQAYIRKNMMRTQINAEEFSTFVIELLKNTIKSKGA